jgi:hypothetical protein
VDTPVRVVSVTYEDESGRELWRSEHAEYAPPGTLVTSPDGIRFLTMEVLVKQSAAPVPTFVLRRLDEP